MFSGRAELEEPLAGKSTLNRMELGAGTKDRYKKITFWKEAMDELLVQVFLESYQQAPEEIIVDVDTTDLPLHSDLSAQSAGACSRTESPLCSCCAMSCRQ